MSDLTGPASTPHGDNSNDDWSEPSNPTPEAGSPHIVDSQTSIGSDSKESTQQTPRSSFTPSVTTARPSWPVPPAQSRTRRIRVGGSGVKNDLVRYGAVIAVAALVGGLTGYLSADSGNPSYTIMNSNAVPTGQILSSGVSIPTLVSRVTPSVVSIDVRNAVQEDQGTGMILSSNGLIVTNNHVIAAAIAGGTITVTLSGSTKPIPAVLIGTDPSEDVALIRAEGVTNLPTVTLGNSDKLTTGDFVVAIGNALGLAAGTPTVTAGIVSALGRTVTAGDGTTSATETLHNMIQTDAAINPGNSGGPLLDSVGQVIGMNTAVAGTLPDGTSAQNIGFAIPVAEIKSLLPSLLKGGVTSTKGGYLGVEISTLTPQLAQSYGFTTTSGALVLSVVSGSGADNAGIRQGDIITQIGNRQIATATDVTTAVKSHHPGDRVKVVIVRSNVTHTLYATVGLAPN